MKNVSKKAKVMLLLHLLLAIYSLNGIFSKLASNYPFLSIRFILCYGTVLVALAVYALGWQQVIKRMPLTLAFANKAVTIVWGIIWGYLFFGEKVTPNRIIGALLVIIGIILYAFADKDSKEEEAHE
ncbi:MAG: EamA family transporter [Lachnospiraceae bacterium]|nr:EamA family transporter [Candidatus Colinaster equi]